MALWRFRKAIPLPQLLPHDFCTNWWSTGNFSLEANQNPTFPFQLVVAGDFLRQFSVILNHFPVRYSLGLTRNVLWKLLFFGRFSSISCKLVFSQGREAAICQSFSTPSSRNDRRITGQTQPGGHNIFSATRKQIYGCKFFNFTEFPMWPNFLLAFFFCLFYSFFPTPGERKGKFGNVFLFKLSHSS